MAKKKPPAQPPKPVASMSINDGLSLLLKNVEKSAKYKSRVFRASDMPDMCKYADFIDVQTGTPCLPMEYFFGTRGLIMGRVVKLDAMEATGKSALMYLLYGMSQRTCGIWANHYDSETAPPPPDFIASLGCNPEQLLIEKPGNVTSCLEGAKDLVISIRKDIDPAMDHPIFIGIDSVSGLASGNTNLETGESDEDASLGKHARAFSDFFREKLDFFEYNDTVLLASGQLKANIVTGPGSQGAKKTTTIADGAFKYHASWILHMTHSKLEDEKSVNVGEIIRARMEKNKLAPKGRTIEIHLYRDGRGWDFTAANKNLLFGSFSPFEPGTFASASGWYRHDRINEGKNLRIGEFVKLFYQDTELVQWCRERLKIRGFGFKFESDYGFQPEPGQQGVADGQPDEAAVKETQP